VVLSIPLWIIFEASLMEITGAPEFNTSWAWWYMAIITALGRLK
jgi:hypothetical protein